MIPTGPFWMICYHGHQIYRKGFERTDNQGYREVALNFGRYSLLSVYLLTIRFRVFGVNSQNSNLSLSKISRSVSTRSYLTLTKEELLIAKRTVETILNIDRQKEQEKEQEKEEKKNFR